MPEAEAADLEDTKGWAHAGIEDNEQYYLRNEEVSDLVGVIGERVTFTIIIEFNFSTSLSFITVTVSAGNDQNTEVSDDEAAMAVVADQEGRIEEAHASAASSKTEEEVGKCVQFVDGCPLGIETLISTNPTDCTVVVIANIYSTDLAVIITSSFPKHEEVGTESKGNCEGWYRHSSSYNCSWAAIWASLGPVKVAWSAATQMFKTH